MRTNTRRRGWTTLWLVIWLPVMMALFCGLVAVASLWLARVELENGLESAALAPARSADRRTLIRRAYFDLLGLPPTPEAIDTFVNDTSADAFETVVDQLLANPAFGERWARHWMDLVRFSETYGHEQDYPIHHAWKYRDYLIRALNADLPYDQFVAGGWQGLSHPVQYGGQGLPMSLGVFKAEMMGSANWSFNMYPGLSLGAMNTILQHGTQEQKNTYMTPLTEGRWMGTMCLTEPQCGTDLAQVSSKAVPRPDGAYDVTGTKIFISAGDHDLCENIVHVALARLPDAPAGTRGISLFIIPKYLPAADGSVGEFNNVVCSGIEHKMGIKGSATCTIEFEGSRGFLLGPVNKGLECMFTFMNTARIGTALQGICATELSFQGALEYALPLCIGAMAGESNGWAIPIPDTEVDTVLRELAS